MKRSLKMFVAVYDDARLLPHFLKHYASIGVQNFYIAADPAIAEEAERRSQGFSVHLDRDLDVAESVVGGSKAVTELRRRYAAADEWVLIADLDEFQIYPRGITRAIKRAHREGANVIRGYMIDRAARDGRLPPIEDTTDVWELFPVRCRLQTLLQHGCEYKCAAVRNHLVSNSGAGHHQMDGEVIAAESIDVHHFKWNSRAIERLESALGDARAANKPWAEEYAVVLDHWREHGRIRWEDFAGEI